MFTLYARRLLATCVAMLALLVSGCGGSDNPTQPKPPVEEVKVVSVQINGPNALMAASTGKLTVLALRSDGTSVDVTDSQGTQWVSANPVVLTVDRGNLVALTPGTSQVVVAYQGFSTSVEVRVMSLPAPTIESLFISGDTAVVVAVPEKFDVTARYSDGSQKKVTGGIIWQSYDASAVIDTNGVFVARALGKVTISASVGSTTAYATVTVDWPAPVKWVDLPHLSSEAKDYVVRGNLSGSGAVTRWNDTIYVWVKPGSGLDPLMVQGAVDLWQSSLAGKLLLRVVSDSGHKQITIRTDLPNNASEGEPGTCGVGGFHFFDETFTVLSGVVRLRPLDSCPTRVEVIAHEIGHALGFLTHTPRGTDVMSPEASGFFLLPVTTETVRWIHSVPFGTRPIN